jgi:hypothetical protein
MSAFWKIQDSKSNKIIVVKDETIYKGNPSREELQKVTSADADLPFLKNLFSLPYSYIKRIENQAGKNKIRIFYGNDSEEELVIKNDKVKQEVFDFLRNDMNGFHYDSKTPSIFKYIKAQLFAFFFLTLVCAWSLYYAVELENGVQFEMVEGSRPGIDGLLYGLGTLGSTTVGSIYIAIMVIVILSARKKLQSRSEIEYLIR